jgi:hypothetical protein
VRFNSNSDPEWRLSSLNGNPPSEISCMAQPTSLNACFTHSKLVEPGDNFLSQARGYGLRMLPHPGKELDSLNGFWKIIASDLQ